MTTIVHWHGHVLRREDGHVPDEDGHIIVHNSNIIVQYFKYCKVTPNVS